MEGHFLPPINGRTVNKWVGSKLGFFHPGNEWISHQILHLQGLFQEVMAFVKVLAACDSPGFLGARFWRGRHFLELGFVVLQVDQKLENLKVEYTRLSYYTWQIQGGYNKNDNMHMMVWKRYVLIK